MKMTSLWSANNHSRWKSPEELEQEANESKAPKVGRLDRKEMQWMSNSLVIINMDGDDPTKAKDQMGAF